jgi:hypothetical protein
MDKQKELLLKFPLSLSSYLISALLPSFLPSFFFPTLSSLPAAAEFTPGDVWPTFRVRSSAVFIFNLRTHEKYNFFFSFELN